MNQEALEWFEQAEYDLDTAQALRRAKRYVYAVFMCHLSVEKALKGLVDSYLREARGFFTMAKTTSRVADIARRYIRLLETYGVTVSGAYLFGSHVEGTPREDSDVDLRSVGCLTQSGGKYSVMFWRSCESR